MRSLVRYWIPVIVWAGVIFFFSTQQFSSANTSRIIGPILHWLTPSISTELELTVHFFVRKLGHWSEYFIFALLLMRALDQRSPQPYGFRKVVWTALVIFLYASSDEIHQLFVPARSASLNDILLDFFGGVCGLLLSYWQRQRAFRNETLECG